MKFSTGSYARPDIYQESYRPENTIIVGYRTQGGDICIVAKSKSGQNYLYTTAGIITKTSAITSMGGSHDFRTACETEGGITTAPVSGTTFTYGLVAL